MTMSSCADDLIIFTAKHPASLIVQHSSRPGKKELAVTWSRLATYCNISWIKEMS